MTRRIPSLSTSLEMTSVLGGMEDGDVHAILETLESASFEEQNDSAAEEQCGWSKAGEYRRGECIKRLHAA